MKRKMIVILACINALLLLALVLGSVLPRAEAQPVVGGTDYLVVSCRISPTCEAVAIIDLAKKYLKVWRMDFTAKRMLTYRGRDLVKDFQQQP